MASANPIKMRVHQREDRRVDGILSLIHEAGRPGSIEDVLAAMCQQVSIIAHADIVSVYVREQSAEGERLVLRGNVGFPESAIGSVRLAIGEGITGTAAEVMRPISASTAQQEDHYKPVAGLGEESFPSFLAIPLHLSGAVAGVLVLQRSEANAFSNAEVALSTALATTFSSALERIRGSADEQPRSARLRGDPVVTGTAMGRAVLIGTLEALVAPGERAPDPAGSAASAFDQVSALIARAHTRVDKELSGQHRRLLGSRILMLQDQRLRSRTKELCAELGLVPGLKQVAREYAVASVSGSLSDPLLEERAADVESLCLLVAQVAHGQPLPVPGSVLVVAERLTPMVALCVVGCRGAAVVADGPLSPECLGVAVARAAALPVVGDVAGLFAWTRPEDKLLVDADEGIVRINPPATQIAKYRRDH